MQIIDKVKMSLGRKLLRSVNPSAYKHYPKTALLNKHVEHCQNLSNRIDLLHRLPKNAIVAEIGVNRGEFSEKILEISKPKKLHLVDMWSTKRYHGGLKELVERKFKTEIESSNVVMNLGMSTSVIPDFEDNYFDFVYLDTDHLLENTTKELALLRTKMKPGGIIAGHDYIIGNWNGVVRYGVVEAVHSFCVEHNWELLYLTHELDNHPSFAIRKISL